MEKKGVRERFGGANFSEKGVAGVRFGNRVHDVDAVENGEERGRSRCPIGGGSLENALPSPISLSFPATSYSDPQVPNSIHSNFQSLFADSPTRFASRMSRFQSMRRVQIDDAQTTRNDDDAASETLENDDDDQGREGSIKLRPSDSNVTEDQEPFMGVKVRRKASRHRDCRGDYIDVPSRPYLMKILEKQGDSKVLFADRVLKFTASGKMKRRILLVTDFAIYVVDPERDALKRRIALAAVDKLCLSELSDNFFAIVIPTEYDLLMASTRKIEIVTVFVEAIKSTSDYELEVVFSNRFEYHAAADLVKEIQFEEVEGL
ncbi:hypothetical protein U1Q18_038715 [Sarracenia purpurea var. burkii]